MPPFVVCDNWQEVINLSPTLKPTVNSFVERNEEQDDRLMYWLKASHHLA
jgi:hypothetical protein